MADLLVASATLSIGGVLHDAIITEINNLLEAITAMPLNSTNGIALPGTASFDGSATVLYDDTTGSPEPMEAIMAPATAELILVITEQDAGTITYTGDIVIGESSATFNSTDYASLDITFTGSGGIVVS